MLNDKGIRNEFMDLGDLNALMNDLDCKVNNDSIKEFSVFVFEVTNFLVLFDTWITHLEEKYYLNQYEWLQRYLKDVKYIHL